MIAHAGPDTGASILAAVRTPLTPPDPSPQAFTAADLAAATLREALYLANWPEHRLDEIILGHLGDDPADTARNAALHADLPPQIPAFAVTRGAASGLHAITLAAARIAAGQTHAALAAGVHATHPHPRPLLSRLRLRDSSRHPHPRPLLSRLRLRDPIPLALTDPELHHADRTAHQLGLTRAAQDRFTLDSHRRAVFAQRAGWTDPQRVPLFRPPEYQPLTLDLLLRPGQLTESLAALPTLLDHRDATLTAANTAPLADGAAAVLLIDPRIAAAEGLDAHALGRIRAVATVAVDPALSPLAAAFAIDRILRDAALQPADIDLWEFDERCAVDVLATQLALASPRWCAEHLHRSDPLGEIDPQRINPAGGALALGQPAGAAGARALVSLLLEMKRQNAHRAVACANAGAGQATAVLIHRRR